MARVERPPIKYAKAEHVHIAYQILGDGPVDMVFVQGTATHLDWDWEWPGWSRSLEGLSSFCRLIRFDARGTGLSDRSTEAPTLEERVDDIRAVMGAEGIEEAVIFGYSEGTAMACLFAASHPERTRSLVLWGGQARWVQDDDYPWGVTREEHERLIEEIDERGV